jgi:hypothetical protein
LRAVLCGIKKAPLPVGVRGFDDLSGSYPV